MTETTPTTYYAAVLDGLSYGVGLTADEAMREAHEYEGGETTAKPYPTDAATMQAILDTEGSVAVAIVDGRAVLADSAAPCPECTRIGDGMGPSHDGSPNCESGSIASGGQHAHCTCDWCF